MQENMIYVPQRIVDELVEMAQQYTSLVDAIKEVDSDTFSDYMFNLNTKGARLAFHIRILDLWREANVKPVLSDTAEMLHS